MSTGLRFATVEQISMRVSVRMGVLTDAGALTDTAGATVLVDVVCCAEDMTETNNDPIDNKSATFRMISPLLF